MDMFNWIGDSHDEGALSVEEMLEIINDKSGCKAYDLWMEYADDREFSDHAKDELREWLKAHNYEVD